MLVKVLKDFYMQEGDIAFSAGEEYVFIEDAGSIEYDNIKVWSTIDDQGDFHLMNLKDMQQLNPSFTGEE